mgnify:CR=1 FL=1
MNWTAKDCRSLWNWLWPKNQRNLHWKFLCWNLENAFSLAKDAFFLSSRCEESSQWERNESKPFHLISLWEEITLKGTVTPKKEFGILKAWSPFKKREMWVCEGTFHVNRSLLHKSHMKACPFFDSENSCEQSTCKSKNASLKSWRNFFVTRDFFLTIWLVTKNIFLVSLVLWRQITQALERIPVVTVHKFSVVWTADSKRNLFADEFPLTETEWLEK